MERIPDPVKPRRRIKVTKNRFDPKSAEELTQADVEFGVAIRRYLADRKQIGFTSTTVFRVLINLGYFHEDFRPWFQSFEARFAGLMKDRRGAPTCSEVLACALANGMAREFDAI